MHKSEPLVSLITPFYNGADFAGYLIKSVIEQNYPALEHVVIDDGSTDAGFIGAAAQNFPQLKTFKRENRGQYATMNDGFQFSSGEIVCFVNQDDVLPSGAVTSAVEYLSAHPDCDAVCGRISYIDERGSSVRRSHPFTQFPLWTYPYTSNIYHGALYIRREFLEKNQIFFDPNLKYAGDYDWILSLQRAGVSIGALNMVLLQFRVHAEQTSEAKFQSARREIYGIARRHNLSLILMSITRKIFFLAGLWDHMLWQGFLPVIKYLRIRLNRKRE